MSQVGVSVYEYMHACMCVAREKLTPGPHAIDNLGLHLMLIRIHVHHVCYCTRYPHGMCYNNYIEDLYSKCIRSFYTNTGRIRILVLHTLTHSLSHSHTHSPPPSALIHACKHTHRPLHFP